MGHQIWTKLSVCLLHIEFSGYWLMFPGLKTTEPLGIPGWQIGGAFLMGGCQIIIRKAERGR